VRLVLLGSPVAHSLSPAMHRAALAHIGLAGDYVARDVADEGVIEAVSEIRLGVLAGANVTMPHKRLAHQFCDRRTSAADRTRAVNTLYRQSGKVVGENTDIAGVRAAWQFAELPDDVPVVILGAGGAAAAALVATEGRQQYVVARNAGRATQLIDDVGVAATVIPWGASVPAGVVVNATSLGMRGEQLPETVLEQACGLLDMPYGDQPTPAVEALRRAGNPVADGLDMLVGQAVESFAIWAGAEVESSVFRDAAEHELLKRAQSPTRVEE
jgi:shikimate dehydrogenase